MKLLMCVVLKIWGDIQLERWILEHWGETATQATISLFQLFCDVINGVEHLNHDKLILIAGATTVILGAASDGSLALMIAIAQLNLVRLQQPLSCWN